SRCSSRGCSICPQHRLQLVIPTTFSSIQTFFKIAENGFIGSFRLPISLRIPRR
ncbi:unnamed protein product, partial [Arabidopsis halleri]